MLELIAAITILNLGGGAVESISQPPGEVIEISDDQDYDFSGLENLTFVDAPDEPEVPLGTVHPSIPRQTTRLAGGNARVRFNAPIRVVVRPRVLGRRLSVRRASLPAGAEFEGPDNDNNGMPDDLERPDVQVLPG